MATGSAGFDTFVYYAGPIVQLLYWLVMMVAAVWAVLLFKRLVDHKVSRHSGTDSANAGSGIDIDQFVE